MPAISTRWLTGSLLGNDTVESRLKVLHIKDGKVTVYAGGYDYFMEKSSQEEARVATVA